MFARFTERARQIVVLAQDEARAMKHNYIGGEHLLLGMLREEEGLAARVLSDLDVEVDGVRRFVRERIGEGDVVTTGMIPFTPRAKKMLDYALWEALSLGHNYVGTEHVLLGMARENGGVAAEALRAVDVDAEKIRNEIIRMLSGPRRGAPPPNWRSVLVGVLNALGDRAAPCPEDGLGCKGCQADAAEAMREGLQALGYDDWLSFHAAEVYRRHGAA